jgi:uncharacterized protein YijF (DUF1287 family)
VDKIVAEITGEVMSTASAAPVNAVKTPATEAAAAAQAAADEQVGVTHVYLYIYIQTHYTKCVYPYSPVHECHAS